MKIRKILRQMDKRRKEAMKNKEWLSMPVVESPLLHVADCNKVEIERLKPFCFLTTNYGPDKFHACLCLEGEVTVLDDVRIRNRLLRGMGKWPPNEKTYGSFNMPGSKNWAIPGGYPVTNHSIQEGRKTTEAELDAAEILGDDGGYPRLDHYNPYAKPLTGDDLVRMANKSPEDAEIALKILDKLGKQFGDGRS